MKWQKMRYERAPNSNPPTASTNSFIMEMQEVEEVERLEMINGMSLAGSGRSEPSFSDDEHIKAIKSEISSHPLYQKLLSVHINCLYVATPTDHRHTIDAQVTHSQLHHTVSYNSRSSLLSQPDKQELDTFMGDYLVLLSSLKDQLERHVKFDAYEAVAACRQIENSLQALTGVTLGETNGSATMSNDEDEYTDLQLDNNNHHHQSSGNDSGQDMMMMGFGLPNESERTLMERVRQELKIELKQGFKSRIEVVREEIMRKRRAGKLPSDTTLVLKNWWQQHSSWPYPTEDDKAKLVEETGLQLKQINNWFINQRKRNWHAASQSVTSLKSKRKR